MIKKNFSDLIKLNNIKRELDIAAVLEMLNANYCFGDRTLVKNICNTPWMAKPNSSLTDWEYADIPKHDELLLDEKRSAIELFKRLQGELLDSIIDKKNIGILLTGGMDSRIIAGTLDYLIKTKQINQVNVVALTWGNRNTRDVVYAERIAKRLKWEWIHFIVTANDMLDNIEETALRGALYSPINLHAILQIKKIKGLDCILAGSYGNSIGRAVYSSRPVTNLKNLSSILKNKFQILNHGVLQLYKNQCAEDVQHYHNLFPRKKLYQQFELDQQLHYMRRMLNPCMSIIDETIPVCQLFTKPSVFGYIWAISPEKRNDLIYKNIMGNFETKLDDIPWSKTGLLFPEKKGNPDVYKKAHHSYVSMFNKELFSKAKNLILSESISKLGIFNMSSLKVLLRTNKLFIAEKYPNYEDKFLWLSSLSRFIDIYKIGNGSVKKSDFADNLNGNIKAPLELIIKKSKNYIGRQIK